MSANEVPNTEAPTASEAVDCTTTAQSTVADAAIIEQERAEKILKAKELYSHGSRNFLVKSYSEAADELSDVCALYEEIYGELSDELGMPYLLYAKSLIALAVDENKVLDVPDDADEDDDEDDEEEEEAEAEAEAEVKATTKTNGEAKAASTNGAAKSEVTSDAKKPVEEADSTGEAEAAADAATKKADKSSTEEPQEVTSSNDDQDATAKIDVDDGGPGPSTAKAAAAAKNDGEKPSTSNGTVSCTENGADMDAQGDEENDGASNLQLAWEILELAAKIFSRQGLGGLPNLAETRTELANIEFENNILDAAREDYEQALLIYKDLPPMYHRAKAEIYYKIGLIYLMQQMNKEGAASLKEACDLIDAEINELKNKGEELTEKDKNNIQDLEETKQEIRAKIDEIEETQAQNIAEVRAALDSYIKPIMTQGTEDADNGPSSSSTAATTAAAASSSSSSSTAPATSTSSSSAASAITSSKPTDISHLIKRKKPEDANSEAEAASSPAKRAAL